LSGALLIEVLVAAVGVALNPPAIVAVLVLVSSSRSKAFAFAGGWLSGLALAACLAMLLEDAIGHLGGPSMLASVVKIAIGVALLVLAFVQWRKHAASAGTADTPSWMDSITGLSAPRVFLAAGAYAALNPKTLAFVVAGTLAILEAISGMAAQLLAAVVFAVIASLSVTAPVALVALAPGRFENALDGAVEWLGANGSLVTAGLLGVIGVILIYSGASGLVG